MNYCNVKIEKLIKFSPVINREQYDAIYNKFLRISHTYPIVNSQGYYRKYGIRIWIDDNFPNTSLLIKERATFILWCAYNRFNPDDEKFEMAI